MFELFDKKLKKRIILEQSKSQGKFAEDMYVMNASLSGKRLERTGKGHDFIERTIDPWTGKVTKTKYVEVKSGEAKLSKLQQKTKKKKSNYSVVHYDSLI